MSSTIAQYIIDPSGENWDPEQLVGYQANGPVPIITSANALTDGLVMHKGYASVRTTRTACQVLVNPFKIRRATFEALRMAVATQSSRLIITGCFTDSWDFKFHVSKADGLAYLEDAAKRVQRPDCFRFRAVVPIGLARPDFAPLNNALELIKAHNGRLDSEFLIKLALITDQRFMICSWQPEGQQWRVEHGGAGFSVSRHLDVSRHQTVSNQPSFEYGCWLHDRYCEVMMGGMPAIEDVDAHAMTPGVGSRRMQYRRLLAPMTDERGRCLLLTTSVRDSTIDLG